VFGVTAYGGGGGGAGGSPGFSGASGGGAGGISANSGGSATQGYAGGTSVANTGGSGGGGSGGAGSAGTTPSAGGNGGAGSASAISGSSVIYAAGGGGAAGDTGTFAGGNTGTSGVPGAGGSSGAGGIGGTCNYACNASGANGVTPGSGGGGGSTNGGAGGNGASGIAILSGTVRTGGGSLTITSGSGKVTMSGASINLSSLEIKSSSTSSVISSVIGGYTALTLTSPLTTGVLTLSANNSYTGMTTLNSGYLYITSETNINNGLGGLTMAGGGLKAGADITLNPVMSLTALKTSVLFATGATTITINSNISGAGNLLIANGATGTVVFGGANTYTGSTTIYGKLTLANLNALSTSAINIGTSGVLDIAGYSISNAITANSSGGVIRSSLSDGAITGGITLAGYYLTLSAASGASLTVSTTEISGTGTSALNIGSATDIGLITLSVASSYTGTTNVNKGTLALGISDALADTSALNVNGGTFSMGTYSDTVGAVTIGASGGTITSSTGVLTGNEYTFNNTSAATVSAILAGAVNLTQAATGTTTLSGDNTYTGSTTISAGTLKVANAAALGPSTGAGCSRFKWSDINQQWHSNNSWYGHWFWRRTN
jgi:autotransporter-associated beta strand protein